MVPDSNHRPPHAHTNMCAYTPTHVCPHTREMNTNDINQAESPFAPQEKNWKNTGRHANGAFWFLFFNQKEWQEGTLSSHCVGADMNWRNSPSYNYASPAVYPAGSSALQ